MLILELSFLTKTWMKTMSDLHGLYANDACSEAQAV